jgi:eukaryotic-like serine/threonine-protein kinase
VHASPRCLDGRGLALVVRDAEESNAELEPLHQHVRECGECRSLVTQARTDADQHDTQTVVEAVGTAGARQRTTELLERGARVARYVVTEMLGEGGMGEVYAATDPELGRRVALKLLKDSASSSAVTEGRARLLREAQAMAKLSHPNVVSVFDVGVYDSRVYLAIEFVDGSNLRQWWRARPRHWRHVVEVMTEAGRGLAAAHRASIVHRDFKPDNVLVGKDGRVYVSDFGIARASSATEDEPVIIHAPRDLLGATLTHAGAMVGTLSYMAPEQVHGSPATMATDQFSFCVSLYEALYQQRPFERPAQLASGAMVMGAARPAPAEPALPRWLRGIIAKGLQLEPRQRFASMDELLGELVRAPRRLRRWRQGVAAAVVAGLAVAAVTHLGKAPEPCRGAADRWGQVWNAERRAQVQRRFTSLGARGAASFAQVDGGLRDYGASWAKMARESCAATHVRSEQSAQQFDRRSSCLRERVDEMLVITDAMLHADASALGSTPTLLSDIAPIERCSHAAMVAQSALRPPPAAITKDVEAARGELAGVLAMMRLRKYREALQRALTIKERAVALGYAPLIGEALLRVGGSQGALGQHQEGDAALEQAILIAVASHHEVLELKAWGERDNVMSRWAGDASGPRREELLRTSAMWLRFWEAAVHRAGDVPVLLAELDYAWGSLEDDMDHAAAARARYEAGLARLAKQGPSPVGLYDQSFIDYLEAAFHRALANATWSSPDQNVPRSHLMASLKLQEAKLGMRHADLAMSLNRLASLELELGRADTARQFAERATELDFEPDDTGFATALVLLGESLGCGAQEAKARALFDRAFAVVAALPAERANMVTAAKLLRIGQCYLYAGKLAEARSWLERGDAQSLAVEPDWVEQRFDFAVTLAARALLAGELPAARRYYQAALELAPKLPDAEPAELAELRLGVAMLVKAEGGAPNQWQPQAREALAALEPSEYGRYRKTVMVGRGWVP